MGHYKTSTSMKDRLCRTWKASEDATLTAGWYGQVPASEIARSINRTPRATVERAVALGLRNRGISWSQERGDRRPEHGGGNHPPVPQKSEDRDEDHIALCWAGGGFPAWSERRGIRGYAAICAPLVYPAMRAIMERRAGEQ